MTRRVSLDRRHWLLSAGQDDDDNEENKNIDTDDYGDDTGDRPSDRTKALSLGNQTKMKMRNLGIKCLAGFGQEGQKWQVCLNHR